MDERLEACAEWRDDIAAWLVAQIGPDRESALLDHLRQCPGCSAEAESLLAVAAMSLGSAPDSPTIDPDLLPPPELGDRVVGAVRRERGVRRAMAVGVVGFAAVLLLSLVVSISTAHDRKLTGDAMAFSVVPANGSGTATVAHDPAGSIVQLTATGLDPGLTYALWLTPPGGGYAERVAAGTFRPAPDGHVDTILRSSIAADEVGRVWVTDPDGDITLDTKVPE
jgi:hypothetical protein